MEEKINKMLDEKIEQYRNQIRKLEYDIEVCVKMGYDIQQQQYYKIHKEIKDTYHLLLDFKKVINE